MKCPNCNKNVSDNTGFCPSCGGSLFGPRSIDLNSVGGKNTIQSNNIKSITGIDINDIAPVRNEEVKRKVHNRKPIKPKRTSSVKVNLPWGIISLILIIIALIILCISLYMNNKNVGNDCEKPIVNTPSECVKGIYALTSKYAFMLPDKWLYSETANESIASNGNISMLIYPTKKATLKVSGDTIKKKYNDQGYAIVTSEESVLNKKKIIYISFSANDRFFVDYYYQYNADTVIYGQITSKEKNLLTKEIKDIIASITPQEKNSITVGKAPIQYDSIFSSMN